MLTFDDGYGDFYSQALPLLKQHGFTATLFQTTGWIGKEGEKKRMLNWRELAEVEQAGIEIGAHTCKHPQLDQLPENLIREELYVSKSVLEDNLGLKVPGLAYPFGYSNAKVRQVARELGYDYGYAVGNALTTTAADKFALPRLTVRRATTIGRLPQDGQRPGHDDAAAGPDPHQRVLRGPARQVHAAGLARVSLVARRPLAAASTARPARTGAWALASGAQLPAPAG